MFGLVLKSNYDAMEHRALKAEARVASFEEAAEEETARQLEALESKKSKATRKPSKKIEVKTEADEPVTATEAADLPPVADLPEVDEVVTEPAVETAPSATDRAAEVKRLHNEEKMSVNGIATQLGTSQTTVRRDLKK